MALARGDHRYSAAGHVEELHAVTVLEKMVTVTRRENGDRHQIWGVWVVSPLETFPMLPGFGDSHLFRPVSDPRFHFRLERKMVRSAN